MQPPSAKLWFGCTVKQKASLWGANRVGTVLGQCHLGIGSRRADRHTKHQKADERMAILSPVGLIGGYPPILVDRCRYIQGPEKEQRV